ncbi:hypothetical protein U1Q18_010611 [Sarracenia purpurea var. burkii]
MAPSSNQFPLFFFLLPLIFSSSHLIHARESQIFSKVTTSNAMEVPNKVKEQPLSNQDQEPSFIPDAQNGYGLYGHDSGQLPPITTTVPPYTTTTNLPSKLQPQKPFTTVAATITSDDHNYYNKEAAAYVTDPQGMSDTTSTDGGYTAATAAAYVTDPRSGSDTRLMNGGGYTSAAGAATTITDNNYYNNEAAAYVTDPQSISDTTFTDRGYAADNAAAANNHRYYNKEANFVTDPQGGSDTRLMNGGGYTSTTVASAGGGGGSYYNGGGTGYYAEKQGMSDTRFLENGRYYYDIKKENNYMNGYENWRGVDDHYNSDKGYYGNRENSYAQNKNSMEGYRN